VHYDPASAVIQQLESSLENSPTRDLVVVGEVSPEENAQPKIAVSKWKLWWKKDDP